MAIAQRAHLEEGVLEEIVGHFSGAVIDGDRTPQAIAAIEVLEQTAEPNGLGYVALGRFVPASEDELKDQKRVFDVLHPDNIKGNVIEDHVDPDGLYRVSVPI